MAEETTEEDEYLINLSRMPVSSHQVDYGQLPKASEDERLWFRLLRLQPAAEDRRLRGNLEVRSLLDHDLHYTALSYAWGDTSIRDHTLYLADRQRLKVSIHLGSALKAMQCEQDIEYIWIDAICINQDDLEERSEQVRLMATIYSNAQRVVIWLRRTPSWEDDDEFPDNSSAVRHLAIQANAWWTRMWVLQECTHAASCPVAYVGMRTFSLAQFASIWAEEAPRSSFVAVRWANIRIQNLYQGWLGQQEASNAQRPLLDRVRDTFHRKCKDPHDKIYALLSLLPNHEAKELAPDYQMDMPQLINNAVAVMLKTPGWTLEQVGPFVHYIERFASPTNAYSPLKASNDRTSAAAPLWLYGLPYKVFHHVRQVLTDEKAQVVYADCIQDVIRCTTRRQRWKDPLEPELEDDLPRLHARLIEERRSMESTISTAWGDIAPGEAETYPRSGLYDCESFSTKHHIEGIAIPTATAVGGFASGDCLIFSPKSRFAWITRRGHVKAACLILPRSCKILPEDKAALWPTRHVQVYDGNDPLELETVEWYAWASGEHRRG